MYEFPYLKTKLRKKANSQMYVFIQIYFIHQLIMINIDRFYRCTFLKMYAFVCESCIVQYIKILLCIRLEIIKSYYEHIGNTITDLLGMYSYNMTHNEKHETSRNITNTPLRKKQFYN